MSRYSDPFDAQMERMQSALLQIRFDRMLDTASQIRTLDVWGAVMRYNFLCRCALLADAINADQVSRTRLKSIHDALLEHMLMLCRQAQGQARRHCIMLFEASTGHDFASKIR